MRKINEKLGKEILENGIASKDDFVIGNIYPEGGKTHDECETIEETRDIEFQSLCVVCRNYNNEEYIIAKVTDKNKNSEYYLLDSLNDYENIKYKEIA